VQPVSQLDVTRRGMKPEARHVATSDPQVAKEVAEVLAGRGVDRRRIVELARPARRHSELDARPEKSLSHARRERRSPRYSRAPINPFQHEAASMTLELVNPEDLPTPESYTHVVAATGSRLVFVAGQVAEDAQGDVVAPGDPAAQARQAFANVGRALAEWRRWPSPAA
jgi:Endoribonuclease L-PSP